MSYYVYALKSIGHNFIYAGITGNPGKRLEQHNRGYNRSTKPCASYKLFYLEELPDHAAARL